MSEGMDSKIDAPLRGAGRVGRAVVLVLLLAACGEGSGAPARGSGPGGPGGRPAGAELPVPVETVEVSVGSVARSVTASGSVSAIRTVSVNSQLSGTLLEVRVEEGDTVRAGAVLARVDDREIVAQLRSAEAQLQVAESAFRRAEQLRERQVVTQSEYERDRAAYEAALSQRDQLRTRLEYAEVRAPIAGVVTAKTVEAGDLVSPQARMFEIADVSTMVVRVAVSELEVVHLAGGDAVEVVLDAHPNQPIQGRIRRVFPAADPDTRLVPVEVALAGPRVGLARPGFLARVSFSLSPRQGVLLVPASAVVQRTGGDAVFVVEDGTASLRTVTTGRAAGDLVEILSGVAAGTRVVSAGVNQLRDGALVRDVGREGARGTSTADSVEGATRPDAGEAGPGPGPQTGIGGGA